MKKKLALFLCVIIFALMACACESEKAETDVESSAVESEVSENLSTPAPQEQDAQDVFILRNATDKDIYSLEFSANDKENLLIDAVLPAGNEVKVKNSGVWEIKAEFMADDGSYYKESFGEADLSCYGENTVIILCENEQGYLIETQQKK